MYRTAILLLVFALNACTQVSRAGRPCPCLAGFRCCETTQTCVPEGADVCVEPRRQVEASVSELRIRSVDPREGHIAGGYPLTIAGEGFPAETRAWIGGRPCADLRIESPNSLHCTAPRGSHDLSRVSVEVEDASGGRVAAFDAFQYQLPAMSYASDEIGLFERGAGKSVTLADLNRDGVLDLFFARGSRSTRNPATAFLRNPDRLYYREPTEALWDDPLPNAFIALPAELTGDGFIDFLLVAGHGNAGTGEPPLVLYEGTSHGTFQPRSLSDMGFPDNVFRIFFGYLDDDSLVDIFGCIDKGHADPVGADDVVFTLRNLGNGRWSHNEPAAIQARMPDPASCAAAAAADLDGDGDHDFVVATSDGLHLFENRAGRLHEVEGAGFEPLSAVTAGGGARSLRWVDIDSDGDLDLSFARVAEYQGYDRLNRSGLIIYENLGAHRFKQITNLEVGEQGVATRPWPEAALEAGTGAVAWFDADHDGDMDAFVAHPYGHHPYRPVLYENLVDSGELQLRVGYLDSPVQLGATTGVATGDLDGDGDIDLVANNWGHTPWFAMRNNLIENAGTALGPKGTYVAVQPVTDADGDATDPNHADDFVAIGVSVYLDVDGPDEAPDFEAGPGKLLVRVVGPTWAQSQDEAQAHFGLGSVRGTPWVRVRFPDGSVVDTPIVEMNRTIEIRDPR